MQIYVFDHESSVIKIIFKTSQTNFKFLKFNFINQLIDFDNYFIWYFFF